MPRTIIYNDRYDLSIQISDFSLTVFVIFWEGLREVGQRLRGLVGPMPFGIQRGSNKERHLGFCSKWNKITLFYD